MARRIGQHVVYQTTKENQGIEFKAGLESLLCRPGDLIIVEDEMKTRSPNYGRVLYVDQSAKTVRIDNQFLGNDFTGFITLFSPTGYNSNEDLNSFASKNRKRVERFEVTGDFFGDNSYQYLRGIYHFSGYTDGFVNHNDLPEQFPCYTGKSTGSSGDIFCYYNKNVSGFVFSINKAFQDNNSYDKIITNTGVKYGVDIALPFEGDSGNYTGFAYNSSASNKRGSTSGQISGACFWDQIKYPITDGVISSEINTYNITQITKVSLTGYDNLDYGSLIYLNANDINSSLLPLVKVGSPYRIERKNASDQIYKIISIREEEQNEYSITATKYDTGKFEAIEKFYNQTYLAQTYYTGVNSVGSVDVLELAPPEITSFATSNITSSGFQLNASWNEVDNATGYRLEVSNSIANEKLTSDTSNLNLSFTGLKSLGNWNLSVMSLGDGAKISSFPSKTGLLVAYSFSNQNIISKPAINSFTIN
jgi:hypothetical protein